MDLVLDASFVEDSDGGSLYVRLLAPPSQQSASFFSFTKAKSGAALVAEADRALPPISLNGPTVKERGNRLEKHVNGPCKRLRLVKIEARTLTDAAQASKWASELMSRAYLHVKPYRRFKVLVNPVGGPGKARQLFHTKVRPILEAAGCKLDVEVTTHVNHGLEIAKNLALDHYDAMLLVSGDGMAHEVLNGFAQRQDAVEALQMPMIPIPAGSGNALSVNLLGPEQGFNLALASLTAIKGLPLPLDICVVTQPRATQPPKKARPGTLGRNARRRPSASPDLAQAVDADPTILSTAPELPYEQYYSFLSQAIGLMADIDLGTEHLRALGDTRFIVGYIGGVLANAECPIDIDVKLGPKGSKNKADMLARVQAFNEKSNTEAGGQNGEDDVASKLATVSLTEDANGSAATDDGVEPDGWDRDETGQRRPHREGLPALLHGVVTDSLGPTADEPPPLMSALDPSWPQSILKDSTISPQPASDPPPTTWARLSAPVAALYAGKIPFVGRDLMQFPFAIPGDGMVDMALMLHGGGRAGKLRAINDAETGVVVYDEAMIYLKVEAYRVTPRLAAGDPRLKKGGLVSIDGGEYRSRPEGPEPVD